MKTKTLSVTIFILSMMVLSSLAFVPFNSIQVSAESAAIVGSATTSLNEDEISNLLFMVEEEKMARDVYLYLYEAWGMNIFNNIAKSEQSHMDAIFGLIERYNIEGAAGSLPQGQFENKDLQALYDQLTTEGSKSLEAALLVGAAIEEIDILDLKEALLTTTNSEVAQAFNNLIKGSENHLRAFVSTLENRYGSYTTQYLTEEYYNEVMSSSNFTGNSSQGIGINRGQGRR